jgi:hypothetical protein
MAITSSEIIKGVTLYWPFLAKKNEMAGKFTCDLSNLNKTQIKTLQDMGLGERVRTKDDDRGMFITCKSAKQPMVVNPKGDPVNGNIVGNGSEADVKVQAYTGSYPGTFAGLGVVMVTQLVEYNTSDTDSDDEEDDTIEDVMKDFDIAS